MKKKDGFLGGLWLYLFGVGICVILWQQHDAKAQETDTDVPPTYEPYVVEQLPQVVHLPVSNETPEVIVFVDSLISTHPCWYGNVIIHGLIKNGHCTTCDELVIPRYGFTDEDILLLAQLLCGQEGINGDGEYDFEYQVRDPKLYPVNHYEISKVLCVVMNRTRNKYFPDTVYDVLMQPGQFYSDMSQYLKTPPTCAIEEVKNWCKSYDEWSIIMQSIPEDHLYFEGDGVMNHTRAVW